MVKFAMEYYKKVKGRNCKECAFYNAKKTWYDCQLHLEVVCPYPKITGIVLVHDIEKRKKELGAV